MAVGIDEPRGDRHLPRVDDTSPRAREILNISGAADRDEPTVFDRKRLRARQSRVARIDLCVRHDQVRRRARRFWCGLLTEAGQTRRSGRAYDNAAGERRAETEELATGNLRHASLHL